MFAVIKNTTKFAKLVPKIIKFATNPTFWKNLTSLRVNKHMTIPENDPVTIDRMKNEMFGFMLEKIVFEMKSCNEKCLKKLKISRTRLCEIYELLSATVTLKHFCIWSQP